MSLNDNEILETNKLLNNQENDKLKFNQVLIDAGGSTQYVSFTSSDLGANLLKGYSYTAPDFLSKVYDTDSLFNVNNLESRRLDESLLLKDFTNQNFMEIKSDKFKGTTISDSGSISIENDFQRFIPISFSDTDWTNMQNRLSLISTGDGATYLKSLYGKYYSLPDDPSSSGCYAPGTYSTTNCIKTETFQSIKVLEEEKRQLEHALMSPRADSSVTVPFITGIVTAGTDGSYKVRYQPNDYHYWFSLDPEQECVLNDELSAKILKKTKIRPIPLSEIINEGIAGYESHITTSPYGFSMPTGIDEQLSITGLDYVYQMKPSGLNKEKSLWPSTINWDNGETFTYGDTSSPTSNSKKIMVSRLDSSKSMVVSTEEEYIRPSGTLAKKYGKVKDRIDLANLDNLSVKFRNIPRKLRSLDSEDFEKYTYNKEGNLVKAKISLPGSVGYVANNFTCWHCINPSGQYIENIPPYYKLANEMRYRAFFGSVDGIENKNTPYMDSKDDWEWIPYEYYYDNSISSSNSGDINYGSIATFLDKQKPKASTTSEQPNYFAIMNSSSDSGPGNWKVDNIYFFKGQTKTVETIVFAESLNDLYKRLQKQKDTNSKISYSIIKEKLPPYKGPRYVYDPPWDPVKDTGDMSPDRILDIAFIKIKKVYYYVPPCTVPGFESPERRETFYTRTSFQNDGTYISQFLDRRAGGTMRWSDFPVSTDPLTDEPIFPKIDLAGIFKEVYGEIDAITREYRLLTKAVIDAISGPPGNIDFVNSAQLRIKELEDKADAILGAFPGLRRTFVQRLENATTESGAVLTGWTLDHPCRPPDGSIPPYQNDFWLYGRALWNSTRDLGAEEQRIRVQSLSSWPEPSITDIIEDVAGNA
jgi:hypothetical protein